jgi:voltage-gated potassium channel
MQRNFKLIFNGFLFFFILLDILFLTFLTIDFVFNLKPALINLIFFDILVSVLIVFNILLTLKNEANKKEFMIKNWTDILAVLPLAYIVTVIFPNTFWLVIILFIIRILALIIYLSKIRAIIRFTRKTKLDYATFILLTTLVFGSLFFFWVESPVNPQANSLDNSFFFMIVTMSTVGYGNIVPYTWLGRLIAIVAIIVGLGYTGWVTAAIATSLIEQLRRESKENTKKQSRMMEDVLIKLDKIEDELEEIKNNKVEKK